MVVLAWLLYYLQMTERAVALTGFLFQHKNILVRHGGATRVVTDDW